MSTSVFLMQLRVAAQGTVVGALSIGLAYTMAQKYIFHVGQPAAPPSALDRNKELTPSATNK